MFFLPRVLIVCRAASGLCTATTRGCHSGALRSFCRRRSARKPQRAGREADLALNRSSRAPWRRRDTPASQEAPAGTRKPALMYISAEALTTSPSGGHVHVHHLPINNVSSICTREQCLCKHPPQCAHISGRSTPAPEHPVFFFYDNARANHSFISSTNAGSSKPPAAGDRPSKACPSSAYAAILSGKPSTSR